VEDRDLWQRLGAERLAANDFAAILSDHFGQSSQQDPSVVTYGDDERPALRLHYKHDALRRIEAGPALTDADVEAVAAVVEGETTQTEVKIHRAVLFAWVPTTGWFRYRDRFQLLPVPPEAPQPQQLLADHPFIAEFPVRQSNVVGVRWTRETTAEQEVRLLLGGLLWSGVTGQRWQVAGAWVSPGRRDGETVPLNDGVMFARLYYGFDGSENVADDFSPTTNLRPVPVEPDDVHYARRGLTFEEVLSVPESLPSLLDTYFALDEELQARVLRACHWLVHAHEVRKLSASAALTSLVQAIEALLADARRGPVCTECGRPTGPGPTRQFQDFVEQYVPDVDGKARRTLYQVRSDIVHGGRLLPSDHWPRGRWTLTPEETHESRLFDIARAASQLGLVAWLQRYEASRGAQLSHG
jgi:hypothetical protein